MKDELYPEYYLSWKDAKTRTHLKYTKQKPPATNTSPKNTKKVVYRILFCIVGWSFLKKFIEA